ncbi:MAG: TlpA disulfide reductase family protein [Cyclobacteriaceae bacterium]|nr:TlpA disulfide reductase family protein [Cyclobacteriaceae bacterium]
MKQLAFFHMARNAYNSAWVSDNKEITEIVDELAQHGLHGDIRQSAEALANRYKLLSKGARLPDVTFTDLSSNTIRLSEFHGKYVLLDFWFIGCKPCQADVPYLKILHADFNSSLEIVSINPRDDLNKIKEYKNHEGLGWSFLKSDMDSEAMEILQVNFFPTYFLLDPDGNIILPPIDFSGEKDLYELIADQLKKYGIEQ